MIPVLVSVGARLLPLVTKLGSALGPLVGKFAPGVMNLLSKVTTSFPQLAGLGGKVAGFAAKNPMMTQVLSGFLPGQPLTSLGATALSQPAAMAAVKSAWLKGAGTAAA